MLPVLGVRGPSSGGLVCRGRRLRRGWGEGWEIFKAREGAEKLSDPDRPLPEVLHVEVPRGVSWA